MLLTPPPQTGYGSASAKFDKITSLMRVRLFLLALPLLAPTLGAANEYAQKRPTDDPIPVTATEFLNGRYQGKYVRLTGTISDVVHDELNPAFRFFIINSDNEVIYAPSRTITESDAVLESLVGAEVSVCGSEDYPADRNTMRRQFRRALYIWRLDDITILKPAPKDPFGVEELGDLTDRRPSEIPLLGRRRTHGRVLALWRERNILIRTASNAIMRLEASAKALPKPGDFIEAVGIPESDVFRINLARAIWRPAKPFACAEEGPATNLSARTILMDESGRTAVKAGLHGRLIRLSGLLRSQPSSGVLYLEDGDFLVPVDASALAELPSRLTVGCRIAVTGVCVMNVEGWRPTAVFPRIDGFTLVPRAAEDIEILSRPPWWTAGRLLAVISTLLAVIVGIVIWNTSLRRLARKRGRELYRAQIEKTASELRTGERTRLAVELHDTISQNLTGISMHLDAAANFIRTNQEKTAKHLGIASYALDSCRGELRNCIWDLRSGSLDKADMNAAIRDALAPYVGDTHLTVRFSIRRSRLSDNTAHSLIRIIRELVANAIRHGHAQTIRVAGATENGVLRLSVTDDGEGFDPANHPGVPEGHFGLQGIRERLKAFNGTLSFVCSRGQGTKAVVSLALPGEDLKP